MSQTASPTERQFFFGHPLARREVGPFFFTYNSYPARLRIPAHVHAQPYFNLVLRGAYAETYGSETREYGASTVVFHPAGEEHSDRFLAAPSRIFSFEIHPAWLERVSAPLPSRPGALSATGGILAELARKLLREARQADSASHIVIEGIVLELIGHAARHHDRARSARPPAWLFRARDIVHGSYTEPLSLAEVAAAAGVHPTHLARAFRKHFGSSVGEYTRRLRIEYAVREVGDSDTPLAVIAATAGFSDQSHFSRAFKRATGHTPTGYRTLRLDR